jgi:hypothetical protein
MASGVPTTWSPLPALPLMLGLVTGSFMGERFLYLGLLLPTLMFVAWSWPALRGGNKVPLRTYAAILLLIGLSALDFSASYADGIANWGLRHVAFVGGANAVIAAGLVALSIRVGRHPDWRGNLALHVLLFGWLAWGAFPWLGVLEF